MRSVRPGIRGRARFVLPDGWVDDSPEPRKNVVRRRSRRCAGLGGTIPAHQRPRQEDGAADGRGGGGAADARIIAHGTASPVWSIPSAGRTSREVTFDSRGEAMEVLRRIDRWGAGPRHRAWLSQREIAETPTAPAGCRGRATVIVGANAFVAPTSCGSRRCTSRVGRGVATGPARPVSRPATTPRSNGRSRPCSCRAGRRIRSLLLDAGRATQPRRDVRALRWSGANTGNADNLTGSVAEEGPSGSL